MYEAQLAVQAQAPSVEMDGTADLVPEKVDTAVREATEKALVAAVTNADEMFVTQSGFELAQRMATALSRSTLLPKEFQGSAANCLVLLDIASRFRGMGISPFTVAQQLVVVHGRPAWFGQFVIALINGSGLFAERLRFRFDGEGEEYGCTAWTVGKDGEPIEGVKVTRAMVRGEGWDKNTKWKHMPEQMFRYRAAAFFGRVHCPELLMGYHTADEIEDAGIKDVSPARRGSDEATDALIAEVQA